MKDHPLAGLRPAEYELRFRSLYVPGRAFAFPCDAEGHVDVDRLGPTARENLARVRALVGREYDEPEIVPVLG